MLTDLYSCNDEKLLNIRSSLESSNEFETTAAILLFDYAVAIKKLHLQF